VVDFYFMVRDWDGAPERIGPDRRDHQKPECQGSSKRAAQSTPKGLDAGKKITGRKRHILVGLLLNVVVHAAEMVHDGYSISAPIACFPLSRPSSPMGISGAKNRVTIAKSGAWRLEIALVAVGARSGTVQPSSCRRGIHVQLCL
jgi:hypothetical protein